MRNACTPPGWALIVNGDVVDGMTLFRRLEGLGHRSTLADDASAALRLLESDEYDLVLIESSLLESRAVVEQMRQVPQLRQLPVIVTCRDDRSDRVPEWLIAGADDYLFSGACVGVVRARVDAALAMRQARTLQVGCRELQQLLARAGTATYNDLAGGLALALRRAGPCAPLARALLELATRSRAYQQRVRTLEGEVGRIRALGERPSTDCGG